jgi:Tol biopolymer transport system component
MKVHRPVRSGVSTIAISLFALPCAAQHIVTHGELPNVSTDGSLITFLSDRTGTNNVFVIAVDGSGERQISQNGAGTPRFSRDGRSILFAGPGADSGRVTAVPVNGGEWRVLASVPGRSPVLSPDGQRVAFLIGPWTSTVTAVANADGSGVHHIAGGGRTTAWNAAWSPDGRRIAYTYGDSNRVLQVRVVNADGSDDHAVTRIDRSEGSAQMPAWSPDGRRLAVQVSRQHYGHIWVVDLTTGIATKLAAHTDSIADEVPAWFPDGKHIAFQSNRSGQEEIWVMNDDGTGLRQVTALSHGSVGTAIPLTPDHWTATDSLRFADYQGRPSLYITRGVALATGVELREGTLDYDMIVPRGGNFMGAVFHASSPENSEVVFFRPGQSGTMESVQYAPALNGVAAAWQVYHGEDANAAVDLAFDRWLHVRLDISSVTATLYLNDDTTPVLRVQRLAGVGGSLVGVWTGFFGRGAYFSNIRYTARPAAPVPPALPLPRGTIADWDLSQMVDAATLTPGTLPDLGTLHWDNVHVEEQGFVLVNRYRRTPNSTIPIDQTTGEPLVDSIMGNRVMGSKVVFARATIQADRAGLRRMLFGYSDGAVVYLNGQPLFFGMNASRLRSPELGLSALDRVGSVLYLPLRQGKNELVFAVTEYTGGWAFWARLEP